MVDLMGKKNYFFALSILILLAGVVGYFINGLQLDIQFQGGTIMQVEMPDDTFDTERAADIVMEAIGKKAIVQKSSTINVENREDKIDLMVLNIGSRDTLDEDERTKVLDALKAEFKFEKENVTLQSVEPFIGNEIRTKALYAVLCSSVLIILYVWWRFRTMHGLSAGICAVVALIHDVMVMFAVYIIFRLPLNESFIAAALTIIGYSINDTVVIYDRIRENSRLAKKMPVRELVNKSVLQSLSRSVNTSITTLISVMTLYIFAVAFNIQSIREFALPMAAGIISGVYSTLFIASPLYMMWQESKTKKKISRKPAKA
jgi:preprotein translocase subunit SecF